MSEKIPTGWAHCLFGDIAYLKNGYAFKSKSYLTDGIPVIRISDIQDGVVTSENAEKVKADKEFERFSVLNGDVLIAMSGATTGKFGIYKSEKCAYQNQRVGNIKPRSKDVFKNYCFYFLYSAKKEIEKRAYGGAQPNISAEKIESIPFVLPPLNEQHRIVAKIEELFSELDKGIESLKTARAQLKVYRQAVLKHAFEGKLTAQWREENKNKLEPLTSALAKDKRREIQPPDSFRIPDSWSWLGVEDLLLEGPSNGRSVKDRVDGFPVLRLTALKDGRIDLAEYKHGDWNREAALQFVVLSGDFLLSRGNGSKHLVGRGGVVPMHQDEIAFPDTMVRLRVDPKMMRIVFFSRLWESRLMRSQIESAARTTAGIYKINQGHIKGFRVPVPGLDEQEVIVGLLEEKLSVVEELERDLEIRLAASETLRQSILKKAFSGQLVEQDPNDESAPILLERIQVEKEKQASKKKAPKRKAVASSIRRKRASA